MKKKALLLGVFVLLYCYNLNGQNSTIEFGITFGGNFSQFTPDHKVGGITYLDYKPKLGFFAGGYANVIIGNNFNMQPELMFASQGTNILVEDIQVYDSEGFLISDSDYESKINEFTIILPIVFQYLFNDVFYIEAGPQLGYIFNVKEKVKKSPFEYNATNNTFESNVFDLGLTLGFGYKIAKNLAVNLRYFLGIIERNGTLKSSVLNWGVQFKL
ncbi:hypothetical protein PK35_14750 [Tamlana nanhaiensis]|uniref:Outer membrane protein beta-barrel domain-containing protein n=1 Tax=Neotamlana nanhaiensis TaxID=1382798 RepID=A0A0D7VY56_9FLAO|nr:porin family protein [Tamlana nanhaiensis]KJD31368.1 hypothetical protein PK35_14750 [Tamlana nanhaiensis]